MKFRITSTFEPLDPVLPCKEAVFEKVINKYHREYSIEINTLEELLDLILETNEEIIIGKEKQEDDKFYIEIFNDYR
jgi:hypothetical protein